MIAEIQNTAATSFVLLHIGKRRFALPAGIVAELAPPVRLHTFPHSSPLVAGVIVRRGRIIPVYDAASVLVGRKSSVHRFYLIARRAFGEKTEPSAIPVDGECELTTIEMQPPNGDGPPYVTGKLAIDGESIDILNFEALFETQEGSARAGEPGHREAKR